MSNARDKANIPALNFSSTGIDDNATSTAITIDSSERVGIGETAPFANVHVKVSDSGVTSLNSAASGLFIESANSTGMTIGSGTTNVGRLVFTDNSNDLRGMVEYNHSNDAMRFYSGGGERMRIDSSGRLFVNATSSILDGSEKFGVNGGHSSFQFSNTPLLVNKTGTDGSIISVRKDGTVVGSLGSLTSALVLESNSNTGFIKAGGSIQYNWSIYDFSAQSDNGRDLGKTSKRWKDLYLGGGLYVGGTGTANKLDDYEEGTFTPGIEGTTTAGTFTPNNTYTRGRYTKVGRLVQVYFGLVYSSFTGTGNIRLTGLPFASENTFMELTPSFVNAVSITKPTDTVIYGILDANSTKIRLHTMSTVSTSRPALAVDGAGELYFSINYHIG